MSVPYKMLKKDLYICIKCSVSNPDLSVYQSEDYKELVAKDLSTGLKKYIFDSRDSAENKLKILGTQWNLCVVNLPINKVTFDKASNHFSVKGEIAKNNIDEIVMHPLLREDQSSLLKNDSFKF